MSIANLIHKIKARAHLDTLTIMYLCIISLVGLSSFWLGRLSQSDQGAKALPTITTSQVGPVVDLLNKDLGASVLGSKKEYVASKNGKMYYPLDCSGAKRIKVENQIFFATAEEAEKSGFILSTSCQK